jgi:hypothetical protein
MGCPMLPTPRYPMRMGRRLRICGVLVDEGPVSLVGLMDLDDVSLRIMEEDLIPALHRPGAVVRVRNALRTSAP